MKKLAALLLILVLCLGVALAETADVVGTWYLNTIVSDGESMNPAALGLDMTMTLNEDKTATTVVGEETTVSYWNNNGEAYFTPFGGGLLTFTPQDGNLVAVQDNMQMIFGREKAEVQSFELGTAKTDATMADYNGTWTATLVDFLGMQMSLADMDTSIKITITDGKVTMSETIDGTAMTDEGTVTVENGVAFISVEGSDEVLSLQLHEGGILVWTAEVADGIYMTTYFQLLAP